jgi:hypothetical protein
VSTPPTNGVISAAGACGAETASAAGAETAAAESEFDASAQTLAELLPLLPEESVRQFHAGLGTSLALPSQAHTRGQRLRAMLDFIADYGRAPTESEYHLVCRDGHKRGVTYVPLSTLIGYYGTYAAALDHAARLYARGTAARTPSAKPAERADATHWTEAQALEAMARASDVVGHWPSASETKALRRAGEALLAGSGYGGLRIPPDSVLNSLFGSYEEMTSVARRRRTLATASAATAGQITQLAPLPEAGSMLPDASPRRGRSTRRRPRSRRIHVPSSGP